ncbi:MAG: YqjD family protein [Alphaproteobacteria bacterium]
MMANAADKSSEFADKAADAAENKADDLRRQMNDLQRETQEQLDRMAKQLRSYGAEVARDTQSHIREHPLSSVGGAFAAGMVVGCLLACLGSSGRR